MIFLCNLIPGIPACTYMYVYTSHGFQLISWPAPPTHSHTHSHSQLSVGRLHSVIVTIKIPSIQSCRKVKVSLDETVGELMRYIVLSYRIFDLIYVHSLSLPSPTSQYLDASCTRPRECSLEPHGPLPSLEGAQPARHLDGRLQIPSSLQTQAHCKSYIVGTDWLLQRIFIKVCTIILHV